VCQACMFEYRSKYGELGDGYIEVHHLDPLSERPELEWSEQLRTSIGGVTVLCADCHRMIHRKRPALSLQELRETIEDR
jgi:5-methylcytosine-specific restriction protein A